MSKQKTIYCLAECFFQFDMQTNLMGGGENFWFQIIKLFKENEYNVECYQFSYEEKVARYKNLTIKGLGNIVKNNPHIGQNYLDGYNKFISLAKQNNADGVFLLSMNLCLGTPQLKTLTVSHGIVFDGKMPGTKHDGYNSLEMYKRWIRNCNKCISVDTNSIKVMQAYNPDLSERMVYIPNYADETKFLPSDNWLRSDKFRVLSARRLQWCRGYTYLMEASEELVKRIPNIEITFCGKGNEAETNEFTQWHNKQDKHKIKYIYKDMSEMPSVYKESDLCIVPTTMAEGTSLACIEGLMSGIPQIITCVGGLTDLIIQGFNGLIIPPKNSKAIVDSVEYLYNNQDVLMQMRENAIKSSKVFGKKRWDNEIMKVVKEVYGE